MSITADLKLIRQQLERAQVDLDGRKALGAMVVWDEQKQSYVNTVPDDFNGLVVHLTPEVSPPVETVDLSISDLIDPE